MIHTEPPQHLRHSCNPEEFRQYTNGTKTFDIKLNDGVFNLQEGDLITLQECDPETGEPTGKKDTRRIGAVLDTAKISNVPKEEIAEKGLSIFSLVQQDHRTLYALYDQNFTVSVAVDRYPDHPDDDPEDKVWEIFGVPALTPILVCPDFIEGGVLESLNIPKWPVGRYSITLLISMNLDKKEPPYDVELLDIAVLVIIPNEFDPKDFSYAELNPEALEGGTAINVKTSKKVDPVPPGEVDAMLSESMSQEEIDEFGYPDMLSDEEMGKLLDEARARGEDVDAIEDAFLNAQGKEDDYDEEGPYNDGE